jgi:hypothetical protein
MKIKGLTVIAIICFTLIIWINFVDFKFEELFKGTGKKIEVLTESISLSYIGGYIFYFLNVYLVDRKERKAILPFVAKNVMGIIENNHSIINCLKNDFKLSMDYYPNHDEFKVLLKSVNPQNKSPFYYKNENWIYLFKNRQQSTQDSINRILLSGRHVDEELRRLLLEINHSLYLKDDYAFNSDDFKDKTLEKYSLVFSKYFELIKGLRKHYLKHLKDHYESTMKDAIRVSISDEGVITRIKK